MSAFALRERLGELVAERRAAVQAGLTDNRAFFDDLDAELAACHAAYVGAAVTEIATLRAELGGPLVG